MKILVISLAGIGDTIMTLPLLDELRANFPEAVIDALVMWPGSKDLLTGNPHLNRVHQKYLIKESKLAGLKYLASLRKERYDVSLNTHPQSRLHYRLVARIIGAPLRISHDYECSGAMDRWLVNRTLPQDYDKHTIDNNFAVRRAGGAAGTCDDSGGGKGRADVGCGNQKPAADGGVAEALRLVFERGHGVDAPGGGSEDAEAVCD